MEPDKDVKTTDINNLFTRERADQGAWLDIKDLFGKDTGVRLKLAGGHSERFRRAMAKAQAEQANRSKARGSRDVTVEDSMLEFDLMSNVLADVTLEWNATSEGKPYDLTFERAKAVYENAPDVRRQAFAFITDARNHFLSQS